MNGKLTRPCNMVDCDGWSPRSNVFQIWEPDLICRILCLGAFGEVYRDPNRSVCEAQAEGNMPGWYACQMLPDPCLVFGEVRRAPSMPWYAASTKLVETISKFCGWHTVTIVKVAGILESSGWAADASQLQNFVNGIHCHGGDDCEEAVEHALQLARNEHRLKTISRVILIGDAPPHFEKKGQVLTGHPGVPQLHGCWLARFVCLIMDTLLAVCWGSVGHGLHERGRGTPKAWGACALLPGLWLSVMQSHLRLRSQCNMIEPTAWAHEHPNLWPCSLQILFILFFCQVGNHEGTKETFQSIATATGGQFSDLSPDALIHAVCTNVLMDIGGEELVMEYRERFQWFRCRQLDTDHWKLDDGMYRLQIWARHTPAACCFVIETPAVQRASSHDPTYVVR